jgi:hypothetical protein
VVDALPAHCGRGIGDPTLALVMRVSECVGPVPAALDPAWIVVEASRSRTDHATAWTEAGRGVLTGDIIEEVCTVCASDFAPDDEAGVILVG